MGCQLAQTLSTDLTDILILCCPEKNVYPLRGNLNLLTYLSTILYPLSGIRRRR